MNDWKKRLNIVYSTNPDYHYNEDGKGWNIKQNIGNLAGELFNENYKLLSSGDKIGELSERQQLVLTDPQTSGGLLVVVEDSFCDEFEAVARDNGFNLSPIGYTTEKGDVLVEIK